MPKILMLFTAFLTIIACSKDKKESSTVTDEIAVHNCNISTKANQDFYICYDSLITDSRCTLDANCIWQGYAQVKLSLHHQNNIYPFNLSTIKFSSLNLINDTTINGITIKLDNVTPYPNMSNPYNPNYSKVKLKITF